MIEQFTIEWIRYLLENPALMARMLLGSWALSLGNVFLIWLLFVTRKGRND